MTTTQTAGGPKVSTGTNGTAKRARTRKVLDAKFGGNEDLATLLLETTDAVLEEGNWWHDKFWGITYPSKEKMEAGGTPGFGENMLGILLMQVRDELQKADADGADAPE